MTKVIISDKKLQEIIDFKPHEFQEKVIQCNEREIAMVAGRRFGKSMVCAYLALKTLLQDNKKIWVVAPTYDLSQKVFDYVVRWFGKAVPSQVQGISYRPNPKIKTARGSSLECKSAENPTGLLGEELDLIIIDEAARIPRNVWESFIFPTTTSRKGRVIFISTPLGRNWFYDKFNECKTTSSSFRFESRDNPYFSPDEWERARQKLPEAVFKQEFQGIFLDDAAAVFRGIKEIVAKECLEDSRADRRYVMGVDLAKYNDFSVLTIMDTYSNRVVYWDRFKEISYTMQKGRISAAAERYNNARIIIDSTGVGDPITEDLKREGLLVDDFKFSNKSKQQLIEKLALFIEQKGILIPNEEVIIDELESFGYEITDNGNWKYSAPTGAHDDAVISLALAVWGLSSPQKENPNRLVKTPKKFRVYDYQ